MKRQRKGYMGLKNVTGNITKFYLFLIVMSALNGYGQHVVRSFVTNAYEPGQTITVTLEYNSQNDPALNNLVGYSIIERLPEAWANVTPTNLMRDGVAVGAPGASAAPGIILFDFGEDQTLSRTFTYDITVPNDSSGPQTFPSRDTDVSIIHSFAAGFAEEAIVGTTQLDELSDPGFSSALTQPANSELDVAQDNLSTEVSNGGTTDGFVGAFTATGSPNTPTIDTLAFRVVAADAGGPPWAVPGAVDETNSPTFSNGNDGWLDFDTANPQSPVANTANGVNHSFNVALDTAVADTWSPTISWVVPTDFVTAETVYLMQFRATASFDTTPFEEIVTWAFNVVDEPLPVVAAFDISAVGGDNTSTDIGPINVSASDQNNPDSEITFTYNWLVNDTAVVTDSVVGTLNVDVWDATIPALSSDQFSKGDIVQLSVSAVNALGQQGTATTSSNPNEIGNTLPVITVDAVTVTPAPVFNSTLTAEVTNLVVTDIDIDDGVDTATNTYQWQRSIAGGAFTDIPNATETSLTPADLDPPAEKFDAGDQFQVVFSVSDGTASSDSIISTPVIIGNSPPVGADASIIVSTGVEKGFNLEGSDADGDAITFLQDGGLVRITDLQSTLDGSQVVPASTSTATGSATFAYDPDKPGLRYTLQLTGLDLGADPLNPVDGNDVTAIHIHIGATGANGPHALNIFGVTNGSVRLDDTDMTFDAAAGTLTGIWDNDDQIFTGDGGTKETFDSLGLSAAFNDLSAGNLYFQIHTMDNPDGDIRGQIVNTLLGDENLSVTGGADSSASFNPGSAVGDDVYAFAYKVNDGTTDSEANVITLNITDNQDPVIENPSPAEATPAAITEDGNQVFSITATDPDLDQTLVIVWRVDGVVEDGETESTFTFTPDFDTVLHPSKQELIEVSVTVTDDFSSSASFTWMLPVDDVNRPPDAPTATVTTTEDEPAGTGETLTCTVTPAGDPDDVEASRAEPLSYTFIWTEANGRITLDPVGPTADLTSSIDQTVKGDNWSCVAEVSDDPYDDGSGSLTTPSTASNSVAIVNLGPGCFNNPPLNAFEDTEFNGQAQAMDPDGDTLTFTKTSDPGNGVLMAFNDDGSFTYQPNADFFTDGEPDSFTYDVTDGEITEGCRVNITVNPVNDPPTANDIETNVRVNTEDAPQANSAALALSGDDIEDGPDTLNFMLVQQFRVRIENVSTDTTLAPPGGDPTAVPLAPGVWAVHNQDDPFFTDGQPDLGDGLEALAEDGDPAQLGQAIVGQTGISSSNIFDTPVGATEPGAIGPGGAFEFTIAAVPGDRLNFATMFVHSNDLFFAPDGGGVALFDGNTPVNGDVTDQVDLWDAGTEVNEEPGTGPNQAPRQAAVNTGDDENGVVQLVANTGDGFTYPADADVIRVTITPVEEFTKGIVQTQDDAPIVIGDMIAQEDLPLKYIPNVGSRGVEEISYVAVDSENADSAPANIEIAIGFLLSPIPNEDLPSAVDSDTDEVCLTWAPVPDAASYRLSLASQSGEIGSILNRQDVGNITEFCFTVTRSGDTATFSSNDGILASTVRTISDNANITFTWQVEAVTAQNTTSERSDSRIFRIMENNDFPVIDDVTRGANPGELIVLLGEGSPVPEALDILRFSFETRSWDTFSFSDPVAPNNNEFAITLQGAVFSPKDIIKIRGTIGTEFIGDFTKTILE